ncbi:glutamate--tRNA ligase [Oceanidesulfovibrio indonesiensis]|uniref:Glutamate--tRNA ligase n=1 Tax=Oceanidesulfovibrio indonesiensis TaxID=54767 RepID=A0A7M3MIV5_9BACT|nr:glutamate--tRNA ligase [Oceanidesulfovibrio indonesiensis]TVM19325.1 glutamate--tRNA ligase [Oceanidesulfovibrio indonesiensis]
MTNTASSAVTRFAPSPTGHLHLGGARTALFSWLLARHAGGRFHLRIEDTDKARSSHEITAAILEALTWLGITWDGEPVHQSLREDEHNRHIDRLLDEGKAYWCECTPEEVEAMRERARAEGRKPKYDLTCRERNLGPGENRVVRFKTPLTGKISYKDLVKGTITVDNTELDDMILRRPDGSPTYNLAVVVDDHDMGVTHVLRGEDHINNTLRQIHLYEALGFPVPAFAHVPLIHGPDKKKLSKRHGAQNILEYRSQGILPEALVNYLARLGWSHKDQEIFSVDELVELFNVDGLSSSAAAFDLEKLLWLNSHYIKESDVSRLADLLAEQFAARGITGCDRSTLEKIVPQYQPRAKTMAEMADEAAVFLIADEDVEYDEKAVRKVLTDEALSRLRDIRNLLADLDSFDESALERALNEHMERSGIGFKDIAQPIRVAVTGRTRSPGLFETLAILGKAKSLARIDRALSL